MKNKFSKVILIMFLVFQLSVPVTFLIGKNIIDKNVDENGTDIKIAVERIFFDEDNIYVYSNELSGIDVYDTYAEYTAFEETEDGYWRSFITDDKPSDGVYLTAKAFGRTYVNGVPYTAGDITKTDFYEDMLYCDIYDSVAEHDNINDGTISGPPTEAYMILRVYNGNYQLVEVNVGGMPLEDFIEKTESGEIDYKRFAYNWEYDEEIY